MSNIKGAVGGFIGLQIVKELFPAAYERLSNMFGNMMIVMAVVLSFIIGPWYWAAALYVGGRAMIRMLMKYNEGGIGRYLWYTFKTLVGVYGEVAFGFVWLMFVSVLTDKLFGLQIISAIGYGICKVYAFLTIAFWGSIFNQDIIAFSDFTNVHSITVILINLVGFIASIFLNDWDEPQHVVTDFELTVQNERWGIEREQRDRQVIQDRDDFHAWVNRVVEYETTVADIEYAFFHAHFAKYITTTERIVVWRDIENYKQVIRPRFPDPKGKELITKQFNTGRFYFTSSMVSYVNRGTLPVQPAGWSKMSSFEKHVCMTKLIYGTVIPWTVVDKRVLFEI